VERFATQAGAAGEGFLCAGIDAILDGGGAEHPELGGQVVRQALDGLPEGPISSRPGLKSVAQTRIPKGEAYVRVEGARGEVGCYLIADGSAKPYRMKWRGASFSNLAILPHIVPGHKVADVVAIMGSVDPVFGEVDR